MGGLLIDSVDQTVSNETCAGGDGLIIVSNFQGAPGPFQFQLYRTLGDSLLIDYQSDSIFTSLDDNTYYVRIMDGTGCEYNMPSVTIDSTNFAVTTSFWWATCGLDNGSITVNAANGNQPYTYTLNDTLTQTSNMFTELRAGTYTVTVTDASAPDACSQTVVQTVQTLSVGAALSTDSTLCSYSNEGEMTIVGLTNSDTTTYLYEFSVDNGPFSEDLVYGDLFTGFHTLDIKQTLKADPDSTCTYRDWETYYNVTIDSVFYDTLQTNRFLIFGPDTITAETVGLPAARGEEDGSVGVYNVQGGISPYEFGLDQSSLSPYDETDSTANFIDNLGEGIYSILIVDSNNCEVTVTAEVTTDFYIPNVITPNGDGKNDVFRVSGLPVNSRFRVYDRWGSRVFFTEDYQNDWDGGIQKSGTYYFELETEKYGTHKGWVQIIR